MMLAGMISHGRATGQIKTSIPVIIKLIIDKGKRNFQAKAISWSILTLGKVARVHIIKKYTKIVFTRNQNQGGSEGPFQPPKKTVVIIADKVTASANSTR